MPITESAPLVTDPLADCTYCGSGTQSNNHLREYVLSAMSWTTTIICTRCANLHYVACAECSMVELGLHAYTDPDGRTFCRQHRMGCTDCGDRAPYYPNGVCGDCGWHCDSCANTFNSEQDNYYDESRDATFCEGCRPAENFGVRGYGHTHPTMWFGGPLPRNADNRRLGYYLGFELEIASETEDARPIRLWERANNLTGFFDCKEDSSVEGFEIATQPFTPQFFEELVNDGRLASFFEMLNDNYPVGYSGGLPVESRAHGLHVHIGRVAFQGDPVGLAAFCYLLGQDNGKHLERIARRSPTEYCARVTKPVSVAIVAGKGNLQSQRLRTTAGYVGRHAINLTNSGTVEIRAFRSTRVAEELEAGVRMTYVAADYIRYLRSMPTTPSRKDPDGMRGSRTRGIDPKRLAWTEFCRWVAFNHPQAFASLADLAVPKQPVTPNRPISSEPAFSVDDFIGAEVFINTPQRWEMIDPTGCGDRHCCAANFRLVPATARTGLLGI